MAQGIGEDKLGGGVAYVIWNGQVIVDSLRYIRKHRVGALGVVRRKTPVS